MSRPPTQSPVRIVVIEDTAPIREEIADILRFEGFEVHEAADGREGLATVNAVAPALVVCDVMMPVLDGHATLATLRQNPRWATLPFVFLTAKVERAEVREGMALGADDYLTKPFTAEELLTTVRAAIEKRARLELEASSRADQLRSELSASLPHELRTSLNVVAGYAEILAQGAGALDVETIETFAQNILHGARHLNRVTENFLLSAQLDLLEAGVVPHRRCAPSHCTDVVTSIATNLVAERHRSADLRLDLAPDLEAAIDDSSLRKVIEELLDNACKFSPADSPIEIAGTGGPDSVRLTIRDAGLGMTEEQASRIGAYVQFDRERREQQGLGLGLSLATRLVRLYGGSLAIAPNGDAPGVTVTIDLPVAVTTAAPGPADTPGDVTARA